MKSTALKNLRYILLLTTLAVSAQVQAKQLYVSDQLVVTLRSGASTQHKVIGNLSSGEKVTVLDTEGEFSKIKTSSGRTAWVLTRYLQNQPIHKQLFEVSEKKLEQLNSTNGELKQQLSQLQTQHQALNTELNQVTEERQQLNEQLQSLQQITAEPAKIYDENQRLLDESRKLQSMLEQLEARKTELENSAETRWFLAGAAVILLGIIIGTTLARVLDRRKGDSWSNLR